MGLAHERVAEHSDPDLLDLADRIDRRLRSDPGLSVAHVRAPLRLQIRSAGAKAV